MRERDVEKRLRTLVRRAGGECLKWVSPGRRGVHDRICILPNGVVAFVETKSPTGRLRPEQRRFHRRMARLGVVQAVVSTKVQAADLVRRLKG